MPELTEDDIKNGWTEEKLAKYLKERERVQAGIIYFNPDYRPRPRPKWANNRYDPVRWR